MTTSSATAASIPPDVVSAPIAQAIGEIKKRRVSALDEYKKNLGLVSFGGPRDSFRRNALSVQEVADSVRVRAAALVQHPLNPLNRWHVFFCRLNFVYHGLHRYVGMVYKV